MFNLPETPANTAITIGVVGTIALAGYCVKKKQQLESQIHDNYRQAKTVDADSQETMLKILKEMTSKTLV